MLEREEVEGAVRRSLELARAGRGNLLCIVGAAGLGKTSLLRRARELAGPEFDRAQGRGEEMEVAVPFALLSSALDSVGDASAKAALGLEGPALEPSAPYLRTLRWLERRERPLLLALDDLHWADPDSLRVLAFLSRRLHRLPVALVAALRPWPAAAERVLAGLEADERATRAEIEPLSRAAAAAMLDERASGAVSPAAQERAWELCRGNPLLIEQLARSDAPLTAVEPPSDKARSPIARLLLTRFAGLDAAGMRCARCAAVLGTSFRLEVATEVAGLAPAEAETAIEGLTESGLVEAADGAKHRFAHQLLAQALYDDLSPALRRTFHKAAFRALAARRLETEAAEHAIKADLMGDTLAIDILGRAARAALAAGASETAARCLSAAVRLSGSRPEPGLLLRLARAQIATGGIEAAAATCERLLALPELDWRERVAALELAGHASYLAGSPDLGDGRLREAVTIAAEHDPPAAVRPLLKRAVSTWMLKGPAAALPLATRARGLARSGDLLTREAAAAAWGQFALESGDAAGFEAAAAVGRRLASGDDRLLLNAHELTWPGAAIYKFAHCAHYTERFEEGLGALRAARGALERADGVGAIATAFLGTYLVRYGRLEEALDEARRAEEFSDLAPAVEPYALLLKAEALLWRGEPERARDLRRRAESAGSGQWLLDNWRAYLRGLDALWERDPVASDHFLAAERIAREAGIGEPCHIPWQGHAVEAHLLAGRPEAAERLTAWLERQAAGLNCRWPRSVAALSRGRIQDAAGEAKNAEASYRRAVNMLAGVDLPLRRAEALAALGGLLRRRGRLAEARRPLGDAHGLAEARGARPLAEAALAELHLAGGRRRRSLADRDRLTEAEARVARLAAVGRTNAEIARGLRVSPHTVQSHLKRVYRKLGIRSRRELPGLELEEGAGPPDE